MPQKLVRTTIKGHEDRRRLGVKAKRLGRKALGGFTTIVTPDTFLRWHRQLVASKWNYVKRRTRKPGRPRISKNIEPMIVPMATENNSWGYDRIVGEMANWGYIICDQTVGNVLAKHGIEPAPKRLPPHSTIIISKMHESMEIRTLPDILKDLRKPTALQRLHISKSM